MNSYGRAVNFRAFPRLPCPLSNLDNDACEAVLVDVHFLVVWHLTKLAGVAARSGICKGARRRRRRWNLPDIRELLWQVAYQCATVKRSALVSGHGWVGDAGVCWDLLAVACLRILLD
jgi:hypothetical protein